MSMTVQDARLRWSHNPCEVEFRVRGIPLSVQLPRANIRWHGLCAMEEVDGGPRLDRRAYIILKIDASISSDKSWRLHARIEIIIAGSIHRKINFSHI